MARTLRLRLCDNLLILNYRPRDGAHWIRRKFLDGESIYVARAFHLSRAELYTTDLDDHQGLGVETSFCDPKISREHFLDSEEADVWEVSFVIGEANEGYVQLSQQVFGTKNLFFFSADTDFQIRYFITTKISVLSKIDDWLQEPLYVGGKHPSALPLSEYERLTRAFPTEREIYHYINVRVGSVLREHFESVPDVIERYQRNLRGRLSARSKKIYPSLAASELAKNQFLLDRLREMLDSEETYLEDDWQSEIADIFRLLYPKYLYAFREAPIIVGGANADRSVDFLLVDFAGHVDIAEIKRPFDQAIITQGCYRNNHIPLRDLSGTVMQMEKYIYYLTRSGANGETRLMRRFGQYLPSNFNIRITNPKGIVIMGRHEGLTNEQRDDFEVIRRQYKNVIDILTYDDLLERLNNSVQELTRMASFDRQKFVQPDGAVDQGHCGPME